MRKLPKEKVCAVYNAPLRMLCRQVVRLGVLWVLNAYHMETSSVVASIVQNPQNP